MGLANKVNGQGKSTVREGIDTKELEYIKIDELATMKGIKFPVRIIGFFIKDGDYGKNCTLIVDTGKEVLGVNVPKRYAEKFEAYDEAEVEEIKDGGLGIGEIKLDFQTPKGKTTMIEFVDME